MRIVFTGDALGAAAFRLAGVEVGLGGDAVARAGEEGALVFVTPALADRAVLDLRAHGMLLVIPSTDGNARPPDFAAEVRGRLGISP